MKYIVSTIRLITILSLFSFVSSCAEGEYNSAWSPSFNTRYLVVDKQELNFGSEQSSLLVHVYSVSTPWIVKIPTDWVVADNMTGEMDNLVNLVNFIVNENLNADESRACIATIASNTSDFQISYDVVISQQKAIPYLSPEESSVIFDGKANSRNIALSTNATYNIESNADWLKVLEHTPTGFSISVEENTTGAERRARLNLSAYSASASVEVVQQIADISATTNPLKFDFLGGSKTITVESEASWKASSSEWISLSQTAGSAGTHTITVTVPKNASTLQRNGFVYVSIDNSHIVEVPVGQTGIYLYPDVENLEFTSFGGTKNFFLSTNDDWSVTSKPDWLSLSPMSGSGDQTFTATVKENNTTSTLSGDITIQTDDKVVTKTIHVTQERKSVEASDAQLSFGYTASTQIFSFNTDGGWTATKDADWISLNAYEGTGNTTLQISVTENNETADRDGVVSLIIAGQKYTVGVHQACKTMTISSDAFSFSSAAGSTTLAIASNTSWTAKTKENYSWLVATPKSGDSDAEITIAVSANNSAQERTGQVLVEIPNVKTYIVNVTQAGQYVKADRASVDFTSAGGSEVLNITTDGAYTVSKEGNWFGYTTNGNAITVMAPANSTGAERTGSIKFTLNCDPQGGPHLVVPVTQSATSGAKTEDSGIRVVLKK